MSLKIILIIYMLLMEVYMFEYTSVSIPYTAILSVFVGFALVLMIKDAVIKIMTFVKGLDLD